MIYAYNLHEHLEFNDLVEYKQREHVQEHSLDPQRNVEFQDGCLACVNALRQEELE